MSEVTIWKHRDYPDSWGIVLVVQKGWPFGERVELGFTDPGRDVGPAARCYFKKICPRPSGGYLVRIKR